MLLEVVTATRAAVATPTVTRQGRSRGAVATSATLCSTTELIVDPRHKLWKSDEMKPFDTVVHGNLNMTLSPSVLFPTRECSPNLVVRYEPFSFTRPPEELQNTNRKKHAVDVSYSNSYVFENPARKQSRRLSWRDRCSVTRGALEREKWTHTPKRPKSEINQSVGIYVRIEKMTFPPTSF